MGKNFEELVCFPTGSITFGSDAGLGAFLSAQEVGSQAAQDGQVVLCTALTDATFVLIQERPGGLRSWCSSG